MVTDAAQKSLNGRTAGTLEMKATKATREIYKSYLLGQLFFAIRSKFPVQQNVPVLVQNNNARPQKAPHDFNISNVGLSSDSASSIETV